VTKGINTETSFDLNISKIDTGYSESNLYIEASLDKYRNRNSGVSYDLAFTYLDNYLQRPDNISDVLPIFGSGGSVQTKQVLTPYNLTPENYIYLTIPNLENIDTIQNSNLDPLPFAKILLPTRKTNADCYNTFVAGTKIYYEYLFNNLDTLEIAFLTNKGELFNFAGHDHSFTLEITQIIDKLEYINPRFGNIEI
jgi:hypothetical protein